MRFVIPLLVLSILASVPTAEAGLVKKYEFSLEVNALDLGGSGEGGQDLKLGLLTGRLDVVGARDGLFGFVAATRGFLANATKIEVINTQEDQSDIFRRCSPSFGQDQSCLAERTFVAGNLTLGPEANLLVYNGDANFSYEAGAGFALATLVKPPSDLGQGAVTNLSLETSLLTVGERVLSKGALQTSSNGTLAMMPDDNSTVSITDGVQTQQYKGTKYLFRVYGRPLFDVESTGLLVPFAGNATTAELRPTSGSVLRDEFRPESINTVLGSFGSSQEVVNEDFADGARQIAPILNGVFFGTAGATSVVNGEDVEPFEIGLVRYSHVILTPSATGAMAAGRSDFLLLGTQGFYTTQKGVTLGPLAMPNLSMILWLVAAAAIVAGFVLKPALGGPQLGGFGLIRLIALIFHAVAFLLSFLLWDNEIHAFLGTSLIRLVNEGGLDQPTVLGVTALFEILPYLFGLFMFGMPIRFVVNSGLKIGGLQKARGIGKGIGNLAVWGLGTPFIPFFLNGIVQPFIDALQNALPK